MPDTLAPSPRPARPRDAASLIILRGQGPDSEVLLGRRAARHRFLPNVFVFPGGRLDPADRAVPPASPFRPEVADRLQRRWPPRVAQALATAAVRETMEETGLLFGRLDGDRLRPELGCLDYVARAITPPASPIRFHARFFLAHEEHAAGRLQGNGELLDLHWVPLGEALRHLPLVDVTEFVLQQMLRRLEGEQPEGTPFFHYRRGSARIRYE